MEVGLLVATIITGGGLAPIAFKPKSEHRVIVDFNNQSQVSVTREIAPNFFIGPSSTALVHTGAKYTPVSSTSQLNSLDWASDTNAICMPQF